MYRTNDPRFRRRIDQITGTLESANESAQSGLYIFGQNYVRPCFASIENCFATCIDASCPSLNLSQRDRLRRQRGRGQSRGRGRAELSFDFYDDWDEDEGDGLLGWGNDEFDRLVAGTGGGGGGGYGTVTSAQPARQRGMSYPKARRKSTTQQRVEGPDPTVITGSSGGFWGRLFGGKSLRYRPSAADLQEHPGARRTLARRNLTEGETLLEDTEEDLSHRTHRRARSGTATSGDTADSYSSRGDIFPSDEEDDAIPLDDEFAMVLERRNTQSGLETESSSGKTRSLYRNKRGKRPSAGSRTSTRRTFSTKSSHSGKGRRSGSGTNSTAAQTPIDEAAAPIPSLLELKSVERQIEAEEEADIERRRLEARRLATERGLSTFEQGSLESKEATPRQGNTPEVAPWSAVDEPSQLPTPLATDDEEDESSNTVDEQEAGSAEDKDTQP